MQSLVGTIKLQDAWDSQKEIKKERFGPPPWAGEVLAEGEGNMDQAVEKEDKEATAMWLVAAPRIVTV